MPKTNKSKVLELFALAVACALIESAIGIEVGAATATSLEKNISDRLERVRKRFKYIQNLQDSTTPQSRQVNIDIDIVEPDKQLLSQWSDWPDYWSDWSNWSNWSDWSDWPDYWSDWQNW